MVGALQVADNAARRRVDKSVNWCFKPSQPLRLYQGEQSGDEEAT